MVQQLRQITNRFPVTLVVRLCTDNDGDVEFWGDLDNEEEFSLDVLDDIWSEADEIKKAGMFVSLFSLSLSLCALFKKRSSYIIIFLFQLLMKIAFFQKIKIK